jgi:GntR family transcriptional repressor for pyruvate dehydrogenase complex
MRTRPAEASQYKPGSTAEVVLGRIRRMIETGELKPGDRLPAERDLSQRFSMSRPSLRAALHSLAGMGLLQFRHGSGTYITEGPPVLNEGPLALLASLHGFTDDEMFEARMQLEVGVAGLAAQRATLAHLAKMRAEIAAASQNPILGALVEMISNILYRQRRQTVARALDLAPSLAMHRRIYRAIAAGDPDRARDAMNQHLVQTQRARKLEGPTATARRPKRQPR